MSTTFGLGGKSASAANVRHPNVAANTRVMGAVKPLGLPRGVLAPDFRLENRATAIADDVYWGERGLLDWLEDLLSVFEDGARYSIGEILQADDESVIAAYSICGRGRFSREDLEFNWTGVTWFRDGQAIRGASYHSESDALEAAGCRIR